MKVEQRSYSKEKWWNDTSIKKEFNLVLAFWSSSLIKLTETYERLKEFYPNANIVLVSTAWEIFETFVNDNTISVSALFFEKTKIKAIFQKIENTSDSFSIWKSISENIIESDLKHILVFSDWLGVNWSQLVSWIKEVIWKEVSISGWLAGDWTDFKESFVSLNWIAKEKENNVVMIWFYWENIKTGSASVWGWNDFGIERIVTKSKNNVVYELDNEPILDLYKKYLWKKAEDLPLSWLLFPMKIYKNDKNDSIVRTLLWVNEEEKSITFAWDIPEWYTAYLMKK